MLRHDVCMVDLGSVDIGEPTLLYPAIGHRSENAARLKYGDVRYITQTVKCTQGSYRSVQIP